MSVMRRLCIFLALGLAMGSRSRGWMGNDEEWGFGKKKKVEKKDGPNSVGFNGVQSDNVASATTKKPGDEPPVPAKPPVPAEPENKPPVPPVPAEPPVSADSPLESIPEGSESQESDAKAPQPAEETSASEDEEDDDDDDDDDDESEEEEEAAIPDEMPSDEEDHDDVKEAFEAMDTDHDGKASLADVKNFLEVSDDPDTSAAVEKLFENVDQDRDGLVDVEELRVLADGLSAEMHGPDGFPATREDDESKSSLAEVIGSETWAGGAAGLKKKVPKFGKQKAAPSNGSEASETDQESPDTDDEGSADATDMQDMSDFGGVAAGGDTGDSADGADGVDGGDSSFVELGDAEAWAGGMKKKKFKGGKKGPSDDVDVDPDVDSDQKTLDTNDGYTARSFGGGDDAGFDDADLNDVVEAAVKVAEAL
eukprot:TRINITY_DN15222_c0_g1_i4.p1 TRINITY_DN15222_c0_g1~~TRINITY_DN15222_c0_g1_i4.p1  ORF type:complete len:423 (+),score=137.87 TRINITY_DN15222_c0_g1_i4:60-1328(+)